MLKKFLAFVVTVACIGATSAPVFAETVDVTASVLAPLPTSLPQVTGPENNAQQINSFVFVTGTCEVVVPVLTVVLLRDGEVAGSGPCLSDGTFKILVGLVLGKNVFYPKFVTITGASSSFGAPVTLFYTPKAGTGTDGEVPNSAESGKGLKLIFDYEFITYDDETPVEIFYTIEGGTPPYTVTVNWGDNAEGNSVVAVPGKQTIRHAYNTILPPAAVTIQVTDATGEKVTQSRALVSFRKGIYIPASAPIEQKQSWLRVWYIGAASFAGVLLLQRYRHFAIAKHAAAKKPVVKARRKKK